MPEEVFSILVVFDPVMMVRPRFARLFCKAADTSSSSAGRMRSSNSTTVTLVPIAL